MDETKSNNFFYPWLLSGFSLALSIFAYIIFVYQMMLGEFFWLLSKSWYDVMFFYFLIVMAFAVIALIIGIKRRKIGSRFLAFLGITVPIVAIMLAIFSFVAVELSIFASTT